MMGAERKQPGPKCRVAEFLEGLSLTPEARTRSEEWIRGPYGHAGVHRALFGQWGDDAPSLWSIGNHRRGRCRCGR